MEALFAAQEAQISALTGRIDALEKALAELKGYVDGLNVHPMRDLPDPHRGFDRRD